MLTEHGNNRNLDGGSRVYHEVGPQRDGFTRSSQINHKD